MWMVPAGAEAVWSAPGPASRACCSRWWTVHGPPNRSILCPGEGSSRAGLPPFSFLNKLLLGLQQRVWRLCWPLVSGGAGKRHGLSPSGAESGLWQERAVQVAAGPGHSAALQPCPVEGTACPQAEGLHPCCCSVVSFLTYSVLTSLPCPCWLRLHVAKVSPLYSSV